MKNKQDIILTILFSLIVVVGIMLVSKIAYSFMGPDVVNDNIIQQGIIINAEGTLGFVPGESLSFQADYDTFNPKSETSLIRTTRPKVTFVASEKKDTSTSTSYYVGIRIKTNTFDYSTVGKTAELILNIKGPDGYITNENIASKDISYVTVRDKNNTEIKGFNITKKTGLIDIVLNQNIALPMGTNSTFQDWEFTLTFVNLATDQAINESANLDIEVLFLDEKPTS